MFFVIRTEKHCIDFLGSVWSRCSVLLCCSFQLLSSPNGAASVDHISLQTSNHSSSDQIPLNDKLQISPITWDKFLITSYRRKELETTLDLTVSSHWMKLNIWFLIVLDICDSFLCCFYTFVWFVPSLSSAISPAVLSCFSKMKVFLMTSWFIRIKSNTVQKMQSFVHNIINGKRSFFSSPLSPYSTFQCLSHSHTFIHGSYSSGRGFGFGVLPKDTWEGWMQGLESNIPSTNQEVTHSTHWGTESTFCVNREPFKKLWPAKKKTFL